MPGIFGYYGNKELNNLAQEIELLISHQESWFKGKTIKYKHGFHGIVDFSKNLDKKFFKSGEKSILVYGNVYSFKNKKIKGNVAEILLSLFNEHKLDFIKDLNGSFILSIYDNENLIIANDRFGSKHIFYNINSNNIIYSSEIKGILADKSIKPAFDKLAISEYFTYSYIIGNKTFFEEISLLPPGNIILVRKDQIEIKKYFDIKFENKDIESYNLNTLLKEFSELMEKSIRDRMEDKKKVGILLSGGLDSRLVACFAKRIADEKGIELLSFTFGTKNGYQEKIAKRVAKKLNIHNQFYEIPSDFIKEHANEIVFKGDGLINIRAVNFISYLRVIRSQVDIILAGFFCSEMFGETLKSKVPENLSRSEISEYLFSLFNRKFISKHVPKIFSESFSVSNKNEVKDTFSELLFEAPFESNFYKERYWEIRNKCRRFIIPLSNYVGWYLDTRLPFIDNEIFNFATKLPIDLVIYKNFIQKANKYLFTKLENIPWEKTHLPPDSELSSLKFKFIKKRKRMIRKFKRLIEKLTKNKILFRDLDYRAFNYYLRTGSKEYIIDKLINKINRNIWNPEYINKIVNEHMDMTNNHDQLIISILQIEILNKIYNIY